MGITIREYDSTQQINQVASDNVVFIPGYSAKGPTDTPTLINYVSDFISTFGAYDSDITFDGWDTSYLYAINLLNLGFPVIFYRIGGANIYKASDTILTDTVTFEAKTGGTWANGITVGYVASTNILTITYDGTVETSTDIETIGDLEDIVSDYIIVVTELATSTTLDADFTATLADGANASSEKAQDTFLSDSTNYGIATAKYEGSYGNDISVSITGTTSFTFNVLYDDVIVETFEGIVDQADLIAIDSDYVDITVEGTITVAAFTAEDLVGGGDITKTEILTALNETGDSSLYNCITSKNLFSPKFITAGGYSCESYTDTESATVLAQTVVNSIITNLTAYADDLTASGRGDVVCYVDIPYGTTSSQVLTVLSSATSSYLTAYAPWCKVDDLYTGEEMWMSPSYIALQTLAISVRAGNPVYYANAGVKRATIANLVETEYTVTDTLESVWQDGTKFVNPIALKRQYGYVIFGQRTRKTQVSALSSLNFLNVRVTANEIKKRVWTVCQGLTFENNDSILWNEFKLRVSSYLDTLVTGRGISDYSIKRITTVDGVAVSSGTLKGIIRVVPIEAVEDFDITLELTNEIVTVV